MKKHSDLHLVTVTQQPASKAKGRHTNALQAALERIDGLQALHIQHLAKIEELIRNITALEQAHDLYLSLYESSPVGYITLDQDLVILTINLAGAALLRQSREELLDSNFGTCVTFWDSARFRRIARKVTRSSQSTRLDLALQRSDGTVLQVQCVCVRMLLLDQPTMRLTLVDITERKQAEAEIRQLAFHDPLTTLPNRRLLLDRLQHTLGYCARTLQYGAVYFIDLDDFKTLNDTQGHAVGDLLLQHVGQRLFNSVRACDTVARLGGDEFVVVIQNLGRDLDKAIRMAKQLGDKLLNSLSQPTILAGHKHRASGSAGVTLFGDTSLPVEVLLKHADLALYAAKTTPRDKLRFFDPEMQATVTARGILDSELRQAIRDKSFVLHYQPQVDQEGRITSAEALLRWEHPDRGLLLPGEFVSYAEQKGLIGMLGEQVLEAACKQLRIWETIPSMASLKIAINISALEFCHPDFVKRMLAIIDRIGADGSKLIFEFTERVMFASMEQTLYKMTTLKARGICFSLDDFGIGYSSLSYLHSLPLDQLKIDRTFVRDVVTNDNDAAITRSIIALGLSLGLEVLAEGVENEEQRLFLAANGCRAYQGYLFGAPGPPEALLSASFG